MWRQSWDTTALFDSISAGDTLSCGIHASGEAWCWSDDELLNARIVGSWLEVGAGRNYVCLLDEAGVISCQGQNVPQGLDEWTTPPPFESLAVGWYHVCALTAEGVLRCFGTGTDPEIRESYPDHDQAVFPEGAYTDVCAGASHSCAIRTDGSLVCIGDDTDGRIDAPAGEYRQVSCGLRYSCAIAMDGTVKCWGLSYEPPPNAFESISVGGFHACGITVDGKTRCWGAGSDEEMRQGLGSHYGQGLVPDGTYRAISAGHRHTCAIRLNGMVTCWGLNAQGQAEPPPGG